MASILLDHHNKMGDEIICNGLTREYAKRYDTVGIFCIPRYEEAVSFMYRDLKNLQIEVAQNHRHKQYFRWLNPLRFGAHHYDEIKVLYEDSEAGIPAERQFYALAGVPHRKKWESFRVERDPAREQELFDRIVTRKPYLFIHDDAIYGTLLDPARMNRSLVPVRVGKGQTNNIFDYCGVIEHAQEIHVVDSVFMFLVDCLPYHNPAQKLFVHRYARFNPAWKLPLLRKDWTILT